MVIKLRFLLLLVALVFSSHLWAESKKWQSPKTVDGTEAISLEQAKKMYADGILFIDVRSVRQYNKRHISGAVNLYIKDRFTEVNLLKLIKKESPFVIYCNGTFCSLSSRASRKAVAWGFTQIKYFRSGIKAWRQDGNPLEHGVQ